jgi:hypothetical protein
MDGSKAASSQPKRGIMQEDYGGRGKHRIASHRVPYRTKPNITHCILFPISMSHPSLREGFQTLLKKIAS